MGGVASCLAAKLAFFPPNPPSYTLLTDSVTEGLKMSSAPDFENVDVLKLPTERGQEIVAIFVRNPTAKLTVLYSHGNAVDLGAMYYFLLEMSSYFGVNVMGYDYSGYGQSTGKPSEKNCYADIEAALRCLKEKYGVQEDQVVLYGQSIGSGPTIDLAARMNKLGGVVLQGAILSGLRVICPVKKTYSFDIFSNVDKIGMVNCPVLVMHGTLDEVVDVSHGLQLWELCKEKFQPLWVIHGGHNDLESFRVFSSHLQIFLSSVEKKLLRTTTTESSRERPSIDHSKFPLTYSAEQVLMDPQPPLPSREENKGITDDGLSIAYGSCLVSEQPNPNNGRVKPPQAIQDKSPDFSRGHNPVCKAIQDKSPDFNRGHNLVATHHSTLDSKHPSFQPAFPVDEWNKTPDDNQNPCPISKGTHNFPLSSQPPYAINSRNKTSDGNQSPCSVNKSRRHSSVGPQIPFPINGSVLPYENQSPLPMDLATYLSSFGSQPPVHMSMENNPKTLEMDQGTLSDSKGTHQRPLSSQGLSSQIWKWKSATKEEGVPRNLRRCFNRLSLRY